MKIFTSGLKFTCKKCGVLQEADIAADFRCVRCNGDSVYSVECKNCGEIHEVAEEDIPPHIKPYISITVHGWSHE